MAYYNRTYRIVDGERIEGSWRHIFIRNGSTYYLSDLKVYADGMIDCWGLVDLATFRQKVQSEWVATSYREGGEASAHALLTWRFAAPEPTVTADQLIAEVADEIERLAGRPTSEDRCLAALDRYLSEMTEVHLAALREAYFAVPKHRRMFLLGDQDAKDWPLRILVTPIGQRERVTFGMDADDAGPPVRREDHEGALAYFREEGQQRLQDQPPPWNDDAVTSDPSVVRFTAYDGGLPFLANDYPAPITVDGDTFPTVEHAYWALATSDRERREAILRAPTAREARSPGQAAPLRADWHVVRLAVMARLVREKFRQHPDLATALVATGDARLVNGQEFSRYWGGMGRGRNWLGRILELVRAELRASGAPPPMSEESVDL